MKRTLLLFVTASAMLYGCSTDPEMNDVQISAAPTTQIEETLKPLSFEQTQQIVAAELGEEVASENCTYESPRAFHVRRPIFDAVKYGERRNRLLPDADC